MSLVNDSLDRVACRVTLLTPPSRAAVATISVEGRDAANLVASHFYSPARKTPPSFPIGRILFGVWQNPRGGEEEIVLCRRGECSFEVNCHGGTAASEAIIGSLVADGAARPSPAAWLAERVSDPIQRAAWLSLCQVRTPRTAGILLDQFRGSLTRRMAALTDALRGERQDLASRVAMAVRHLDRLLDLEGVGLHLTTPWRVVFAGPPNVGKSSLVNAILGYQRAIVFDQPGTTRDVLTATTALDGWPFELCDTAGLRESSDAVEAEGVARAKSQIVDADLVVFVEDRSARVPAPLANPAPTIAVLLVANKCDLPATHDETPCDWLLTSAATGLGIERLMQAIVDRLVCVTPEPGEAVPFTSQQFDGLQRMRDAVRGGLLSDATECGKSLLGVGR